MTIQELVNQLDDQIKKSHEEYNELFRQLHQYSNRILDDEAFKKAQILLGDIQDKYEELHPAFNYIGRRYEFVCKVVNAHYDWCEKLKQTSQMTGTKEQAEDILRNHKEPQGGEINIVH